VGNIVLPRARCDTGRGDEPTPTQATPDGCQEGGKKTDVLLRDRFDTGGGDGPTPTQATPDGCQEGRKQRLTSPRFDTGRGDDPTPTQVTPRGPDNRDLSLSVRSAQTLFVPPPSTPPADRLASERAARVSCPGTVIPSQTLFHEVGGSEGRHPLSRSFECVQESARALDTRARTFGYD